MDRQLFRLMLAMCLLAAGCAPKGDLGQASRGAAQDDTCVASEKDRYFRLQGAMRDNWRTMNRTVGARPESGYSGAQLLGLPVSSLFKKVIPNTPDNHPSNDDGTSDFQCFERGILNTVTNDAGQTIYVGALLGSMAWAERNDLKATDQSKQPLPESSVGSYDQSRGGTVDCGNAIISFYNQGGGQLAFGLPMSNVINGVASDGKTYQMQYFQRYVMECHPASDGLYNVMLGLLGSKYCATVAMGHQLGPNATPTPSSANGSDVQDSDCVPQETPEPQPAPTPLPTPSVVFDTDANGESTVSWTDISGARHVVALGASAFGDAFFRLFTGSGGAPGGVDRQVLDDRWVVRWYFGYPPDYRGGFQILPELVQVYDLYDNRLGLFTACQNIIPSDVRGVTLSSERNNSIVIFDRQDAGKPVWGLTWGKLNSNVGGWVPYANVRSGCTIAYSRVDPNLCYLQDCRQRQPNPQAAIEAVVADMQNLPPELKEALQRAGQRGESPLGLPAPQTVAGIDGFWTKAAIVTAGVATGYVLAYIIVGAATGGVGYVAVPVIVVALAA